MNIQLRHPNIGNYEGNFCSITHNTHNQSILELTIKLHLHPLPSCFPHILKHINYTGKPPMINNWKYKNIRIYYFIFKLTLLKLIFGGFIDLILSSG